MSERGLLGRSRDPLLEARNSGNRGMRRETQHLVYLALRILIAVLMLL
jgi:hypothetical protein